MVRLRAAPGLSSTKGDKQDEWKTLSKDYYMRERSFDSFEPTFAVPNRSQPQITLTCSAACWLAAMLMRMSMGYLRGLMGPSRK